MYKELVKAVNELPKNAVENAPKEITRKGYNTTGYGYQFLVNVLNEVVGIGDWGFDYLVLKEIEGKWGSGKGFWEITVEVKAWIKLEKDKVAQFTCVGGHKSEMHADALKGAITNGFKKTVAFFGVGKKAYEGTIDEDYRPLPQGSSPKPQNAAQQPTGASKPSQATPNTDEANMRVDISEMLKEMCNGDIEAVKNSLESISGFEGSKGYVKGKRSTFELKGKWLANVQKKVREEWEKWGKQSDEFNNEGIDLGMSPNNEAL